jgi:hypothetical protein
VSVGYYFCCGIYLIAEYNAFLFRWRCNMSM